MDNTYNVLHMDRRARNVCIVCTEGLEEAREEVAFKADSHGMEALTEYEQCFLEGKAQGMCPECLEEGERNMKAIVANQSTRMVAHNEHETSAVPVKMLANIANHYPEISIEGWSGPEKVGLDIKAHWINTGDLTECVKMLYRTKPQGTDIQTCLPEVKAMVKGLPPGTPKAKAHPQQS